MSDLAPDTIIPGTPAVSLLTLSIDPRSQVLLTPELLDALGIKHGAPIELVPPRQRNGGSWHLDVRPTANRRLTHTRHTYPRFESGYHLSPRHFRAGPGQLFSRLTLVLESAPPPYTGYYQVRPNHSLSILADVPEPAAQ